MNKYKFVQIIGYILISVGLIGAIISATLFFILYFSKRANPDNDLFFTIFFFTITSIIAILGIFITLYNYTLSSSDRLHEDHKEMIKDHKEMIKDHKEMINILNNILKILKEKL